MHPQSFRTWVGQSPGSWSIQYIPVITGDWRWERGIYFPPYQYMYYLDLALGGTKCSAVSEWDREPLVHTLSLYGLLLVHPSSNGPLSVLHFVFLMTYIHFFGEGVGINVFSDCFRGTKWRQYLITNRKLWLIWLSKY